MTDEDIMIAVVNDLIAIEPFMTAREVGEKYNVTSQKASGILRKMENQRMILSKKIKAGRSEVKCYFIK